MDFKVRISQTALTGFEEILAYSWANFPEAAERFGKALLNHAGLLAKFPHIGAPVKGGPGIRQLVHTPILIYYRVDEARRLVSSTARAKREKRDEFAGDYAVCRAGRAQRRSKASPPNRATM